MARLRAFAAVALLMAVSPLYADQQPVKSHDIRPRDVQRCAPGVYADDCYYYDNRRVPARHLPESRVSLRPCDAHRRILTDYGVFCDDR